MAKRKYPLTANEIKLMQTLLKQTAQREGKSVECIKRAIENTARAIMENPPTPAAQVFWYSIPIKGLYPSAEEVIFFILSEYMQQKIGIAKICKELTYES